MGKRTEKDPRVAGLFLRSRSRKSDRSLSERFYGVSWEIPEGSKGIPEPVFEGCLRIDKNKGAFPPGHRRRPIRASPFRLCKRVLECLHEMPRPRSEGHDPPVSKTWGKAGPIKGNRLGSANNLFDSSAFGPEPTPRPETSACSVEPLESKAQGWHGARLYPCFEEKGLAQSKG